MQSPKIITLSWCKKGTNFYLASNYPHSCFAILDRRCKFPKLRGFLSPRYRVCTDAIFISRGSFRDAEHTNFILVVCVNRVQTSTGLQITRSYVSPYRALTTNFRNFEASFRHGSVFEPKQYSYQKEALGMQSSRILSLDWCNNGTNLYGASNYTLSCIAI